MKHKHYDMIVAKASNMDLVVFVRKPNEQQWSIGNLSNIVCHDDYDCFLCIPKHNEENQCLQWLNGASVVSGTGATECEIPAYDSSWNQRHWFMDVDVELRIKPRKEKRWIGVRAKDGATTSTHNTVQKARIDVAGLTGNWQFIEIEVDV